jgi:hypothetical protein
MATYVNNLRLKEITTGDEDGTWGTSTNTNLELVTDGFSYGTKQMAADANETFTMPDATTDATRGFYLQLTSAVSLTGTRVVTLGPDTVSKVWLIENATTGSQIITIKQGSGGSVNVANGSKVMIVTDGLGAGAAVINANPTEVGGSVTSVSGTGTVNGITLTGTVTSSGNLTLGGTLGSVDLTSQITGTLPVANGGTALTALGTAGQVLAVNAGATALEYTSDAGGSVTSVAVSGGTTGLTTSGGPVTGSGTITFAGTLAVANGGTNSTNINAARQEIALPALADVHTSTPATLVDGQYCVAGAGSITFTLPASPAIGDSVIIKDGTGAAATTSFTVGRNGSNIASSATDLTFDKNFAEITLTYIDGTIGWSV